MQNTHNQKGARLWINNQLFLIDSLRHQPVIVVYRLTNKFNNFCYSKEEIFSKIKLFESIQLKHLEIAWSPNPGWVNLIQEVKEEFTNISIGAASIINHKGLDDAIKANVSYAMSPFWDDDLQCAAKEANQLLIPGVFTPTEIYKAINFGHKVIKLFPASILGSHYLHQLTFPLNVIPFCIGAGGLRVKDIDLWIENGFGAITLGRKLIESENMSKELKVWIQKNRD